MLGGPPAGLVNGWLGTAEQRQAVEEMFGVRIASNSVACGLWSANFWSPYASTPDTMSPRRVLTTVAYWHLERPAGCLPRLCVPFEPRDVPDVHFSCFEHFDSLILEHWIPEPPQAHGARRSRPDALRPEAPEADGDSALSAARRRVMPSSAIWQVVGYVDSDVRIVRQLVSGQHGQLDVHGMPTDVRDAPREGGSATLGRFALVQGIHELTLTAARAMRCESFTCAITYWGNRRTVQVTQRVLRGHAACPPDSGAPAHCTEPLGSWHREDGHRRNWGEGDVPVTEPPFDGAKKALVPAHPQR
jgi:hypothetical protein